jgi:hypothetical protein
MRSIAAASVLCGLSTVTADGAARTVTCGIDRSLLNEETLELAKGEVQTLFKQYYYSLSRLLLKDLYKCASKVCDDL